MWHLCFRNSEVSEIPKALQTCLTFFWARKSCYVPSDNVHDCGWQYSFTFIKVKITYRLSKFIFIATSWKKYDFGEGTNTRGSWIRIPYKKTFIFVFISIEIGWGDVDWIDMAQDGDQWRALMNAVMNLRVPQNAGKLLSSCTPGGLSRRSQLHGVSFLSTVI
jgi:hypothetical protein